MSTRNRVAQRAEAIYSYLKEHLNEPHTIDQLMAATGLQDSATTRAAIKKARDLAIDDGLCFPVACWDNGLTYCVTDDPKAVIDPAIHLGKIANGVGVRKDVHDNFIRSRMSHLTPAERQMFHSLEQYESSQRENRKAYASLLKAVTGMRREARDDS